MRLWTLHPKYLDARGLVALWREALLAQAVLEGKTRGYTNHPQLIRFRSAGSPRGAITVYLREVHREAESRGYHFDAKKIHGKTTRAGRISVTRGQLAYEWKHLRGKLEARDPAWLAGLRKAARPDAHPLFRIVAGGVAEWEKVKGTVRTRKLK